MFCAVFIRCTTAVTRCHSLPFVNARRHSLYYSLSLFITCCTTRCYSLSYVVRRRHSLSLVVPLVFTDCHSLSLVVPLALTRSHFLSLVAIHCHSLSLDVPLVCLFINDQVGAENVLLKLNYLQSRVETQYKKMMVYKKPDGSYIE